MHCAKGQSHPYNNSKCSEQVAIAPCSKYSNINECKHIDYINVHLVQQIAITYRCIC